MILEPQKIKSDTVSTVSQSISHEVIGPDAMIFVFWMLSDGCKSPTQNNLRCELFSAYLVLASVPERIYPKTLGSLLATVNPGATQKQQML